MKNALFEEIDMSIYVISNQESEIHLTGYKNGSILLLVGYITVQNHMDLNAKTIARYYGFDFTETAFTTNRLGDNGIPITGFLYGDGNGNVMIMTTDTNATPIGVCFTGVYKLTN